MLLFASGGFSWSRGSTFCAPGAACVLGFEFFGAQRQGVRGFRRTGGRGGDRVRDFVPLDARGSRFWVRALKIGKETHDVFFKVFFCVILFQM